MRVTGNNRSEGKSLSILIYMGGLSFFDNTSGTQEHYQSSSTLSPGEACAAIEGYYSLHPDTDTVCAIVADGRGIIVPEPLFDPSCRLDYVTDIGINFSPSKETVGAHTRDDIAYLTVINKTVDERLNTIYRNVVITNPIMAAVNYCRRMGRGTVITLDRVGDFVTITLWKGKKMLLAEQLPGKSVEDMVFYIEHLLHEHDLESPLVLCPGLNGSATASMLSVYYKVETIDPPHYFAL